MTATRYLSALPGMDWPAIPSETAARKLAVLFAIEQQQWRPPAEIATAQFEQLGRVARFASETVPYYRRQLGTGFSRERLDPRSWLDVPILSRKALHDAGPELQSERIPAEHGRTFEMKTSGSTGLVVKVLGTDLTQFFWQVFCLRDHLWHRRDFGQKLAVIRYQRDPSLKAREGVGSAGWGPATDDAVPTGPSIQFHIGHGVELLAGELASQNPGYLLTHPSMMLGLARHCLENGIRIPGLLEARTLGESSSDSLREACRQAWGVPVVDIYTCQEAGYLALQCPDHNHLHVQSENVLLEVVDDQGKPCTPGQVGRVLVTSLNNFATPLIRYEIGDYAEVGDPCPCGRGLPVLKQVMGRYRNLLTRPDGSKHWPIMGNEGRLRDIAPIELMQMVQTSLEEVQVRLVMARELYEPEKQDLTAFIRNNLGHPFRLNFDYVDSIRNSANGKIEQFISLI
jgi:phenylacetate-CoA ligase